MSRIPVPATKTLIIVTGNCRYTPAQKTIIVGWQYMYQLPNASLGEVTRSVFNISRLNKSRQYFKMVDEKNIVTFHISEQLSLQEQISSYEMEKFFKLWIKDSRSIGVAQGRVKRKPSEKIRYYELKYACIHGSKTKFKPRKQDKPP